MTASRGRPSTSLHFAVGQIDGKLDQLIASLLPQLQALAQADQDIHLRVDGVDIRVDEIERWQARIMGGVGVVVFLVGAWEVVRYVSIR